MARDKSIIKKHAKLADKILFLEPEMKELSEEQLKNKTTEFKERLNNGETLDDLLVEAFAVAREAANRALGLNAYKVQLIGGIILHNGDIAEMKTGEGKTLTGLFPAYLNALTGKGVHIVTVNEYLSKRDSEINGKVYELLGISVGLNSRDKSKTEKRNAYSQDITYTTNSEIGFDYLKDNMVYDIQQKVQRGLNFAIIDEADSVLIDEARTPLIISGGSQNRANFYEAADKCAKTFKEKVDVDIDLETKQVFLTDTGIKKTEAYFSVKNLFDVKNAELFHLVMNALKANFTFRSGVEYTPQNNEIVLIDQFTGRVMPGRSYSDGLQQALQAKENVRIEEETSTVATITYQNFYRLYNKLSGMTGTAKTEEEEFIKIYNTRVIVCPTNKPIIRKDEPDFTFGPKSAALKKMVADIKEINSKGRPILIGTTSVESSEQVARFLESSNVKFEMINAKNHSREAEIIENAGQEGAITLATNMAGRGTDIKLSQKTKDLGGLFVIGVERNEARRIDNQLRGRAGRQGDPGSSRFYISMDDELMLRFANPKVRQMFLKLGDDHIKSKMFTRALTNAQKRLEGLNFDQRKNVLDYDNVLSQHRESMYAQRDNILETSNLLSVLEKFAYTYAFEMLGDVSEVVKGEKTINTEKLIINLEDGFIAKNALKVSDFVGLEKNEIARKVTKEIMEYYSIKVTDIPPDVRSNMERKIILQAFDKYWTRHINLSQKLRSGIYLQQYVQNNPLHEYIEQSAKLYNRMKIDIAKDSVDNLLSVTVKDSDKNDNRVNLEEVVNTLNLKVKATEQKDKKQIEITDDDIDNMLSEIGIKKEDFNRINVEERFKQLLKENESNPEKLKKVQFQKMVLGGLMDKLDEAAAQRAKTISVSLQDVQKSLEKFSIKPTEVDIDKIEKGFKKLVKELTEKEHIDLLTIEANMLKAFTEEIKKRGSNPFTEPEIIKQLEEAEKNLNQNPDKEITIKSKDGKVTKKIKTSKGEIDEFEDSERVETKTKIG